MEKKHPNYCSICKKVVPGGRTRQHSTKRDHLKLLISYCRAQLAHHPNLED